MSSNIVILSVISLKKIELFIYVHVNASEDFQACTKPIFFLTDP